MSKISAALGKIRRIKKHKFREWTNGHQIVMKESLKRFRTLFSFTFLAQKDDFFNTSAENSVDFAGRFLQGRWARFKAHRWATVQNRWRLGLAGLNRAIVATGRSEVQPAGSPGFETPPAAGGYSTGSWCRINVLFLNLFVSFYRRYLSATQTVFSNLHIHTYLPFVDVVWLFLYFVIYWSSLLNPLL
jgi:hypothetical protein